MYWCNILRKMVRNMHLIQIDIGDTFYRTKYQSSNSSSKDSIVQILAGAYAYFEHFRKICEESQDLIFEIAILLAKNSNLKRVNNLRASLLHSMYNKSSFETVLTTMLNNVLKHTPSYSETSKCLSCKYFQERSVPIVGVNSNVYNNNMKNLEIGIISNFPVNILCKCSKILDTERKFGEHFFVELPSCTNYNASDFEETAVFQIKDVPLVLNVFNNKYVLFGLIIFKPPFLECDIGHYTSAIRINNKWEMFDDQRSQSYTISPNANVVVHSIMYIKSTASDDVQNEFLHKSSIDIDHDIPVSDSKQIRNDFPSEHHKLPDDNLHDPPHSMSPDNSFLEESVPAQVLREDTIQSGDSTSFEISEHGFESFYRLYHQELV